MPVADGCTYDTFLSYAHVDDLPVPNSNDTSGWVTVFYETLESSYGNDWGVPTSNYGRTTSSATISR